MSAAQTSVRSRVPVRWYQIAVVVLGLALAAVTALTVYLAARDTAATPIPPSNSTIVAEQPCYRPQVPC
jgi:hypothetical protein